MSKKHKKPSPARSAGPSESSGKVLAQAPISPVDEAEPVAERRPFPIFLIVLLVMLLYWGDMYLMDRGGDVMGKTGAFPRLVFDPYKSYADLVEANPVDIVEEYKNKGRLVFNFSCVACHQATGQGVAGQFPPLAGSEWVNAEGANRIIHAVLTGLQGPITVTGQQFNNSMPPWKDNLTDEQIAQVLTYIRAEWGNKASAVTPDQVKKVRDQVGNRNDPSSEEELKKLSDKVE